MRLAVLSRRHLVRTPVMANLEDPLESAMAAYDDTTLVDPPGLGRGNLRASCPSWLSAIRTVRRADTIFWIQYHLRPDLLLWALAYTRLLTRRSFYAIDTWEPAVRDVARFADAQQVTTCFVMFHEAYRWIRANCPSVPVEWVPVAYNDARFRDTGAERDIFALSLGRRYEPTHQALRRYCEERGLPYVYDRYISGEELTETMARTRNFLVTPPDLDNPARTGAFSPITLRYLEGLGSGCRLLGVSPGSGELGLLLGDGAIRECLPDGSDLDEVLATAGSPAEEEARVAAAERARAGHTWGHRARQIVEHLRDDA